MLHSVAYYLDNCWWYLGGGGMSFPSVRPPQRVEVPKEAKPLEGLAQLDPVDWQRYVNESDAASRECANWLIDPDLATYAVGKPGFFSRYAAGMGGGWAMYCVSDAPQPSLSSFDAFIARFERHWFIEPPEDLPADICLITRDVDAAYLDLFFRDEWMYQAVWSFLLGKGMNPRRFERQDLGHERRR